MATTEQNFQTVQQFMYDVWSRGDMDVIDKIIDPDFNFILAFAHLKNKEEFRNLVQRNRSVFEGLFYHVDDPENDIVANETKAAVCWRMTSKHIGTWRNVPASNNDITIKGITFFKINEQGLLIEARVQNDVLGMMKQINGVKMLYE